MDPPRCQDQDPSAGCTMEFRVRYFECDPMGHLHHANYWIHFETIRTELLRSQGFAYRDLEAQGVFFVVHKMACTFRKPVRYDDVVTIHCRVDRITPARVDHSYSITRDDLLFTEASSTLACVGRHGRPIAMPRDLWHSRHIPSV